MHAANTSAALEESAGRRRIVDSEEKVAAFLPLLDAIVTSCLVTLEEAKVLRYGA